MQDADDAESLRDVITIPGKVNTMADYVDVFGIDALIIETSDDTLPDLQVTEENEQAANEEDSVDGIPEVTTFRALNKKPGRDKFSRNYQEHTIDSQDSLDYEDKLSFEK